METKETKTNTAITPKEILLKYIEPSDNSYLLQKIKELEEANIKLNDIIADPKKLEKYNNSKRLTWLSTAQGELSYNERQINYYNNELSKGAFRSSGRANVMKVMDLYENQPCVAAGILENLMGLFIIRGKQKAFAFVVQKEDFYIGGYSYKIGSVSIEQFYKMFDEIYNKQNGVEGPAKIFDKDLFEQIKKEILVKAIQGK